MARYACLTALCLIFQATAARADDSEAFSPLEGTRLQLDVDYVPVFVPETSPLYSMAMAVHGQWQVHRNVVLDFAVPTWTFGNSGANGTEAGSGNVTVGMHGVGHVLPSFVLWGGISASIPTEYGQAILGDPFGGAALASDFYEGNWFLPGYAFLRVPFGFDVRFAQRWEYRLEIAPVVMLPTESPIPKGSVLPVLESASEFEVHLPASFLVGLRLQMVVLFLQDSEGFAVAAEPYVGYEPVCPGFIARLGVLAGDGSLGLDVALRLSVGWKF